MPEVSTPILLAVFIGTASVFLVVWIVVTWWLNRRKAVVQRRIHAPDDSDPTILLDDVLAERGGWWRGFYRRTQERLERTELQLEPAEALAIIFFCGVVLAAIVFFWRYEEQEAWMALPAFVIGAGIPFTFFLWRQRMWRKRLQDQLPDMLFLLARSLRAGMSIDQSIQILGDHGVAPLSREFSRMHRQLELGLGLPQVLQVAADRVQFVDFRVFASVLSLHRSTGGNLPVIVDRLAHTTRDHNHLRGYYRTATALGRYGTVIILALASIVLFYVWFFHRDLAILYLQSTEGIVLLVIGILLIIVGVTLLFFLTRGGDVD